jgi:hypothetical protein
MSLDNYNQQDMQDNNNTKEEIFKYLFFGAGLFYQ